MKQTLGIRSSTAYFLFFQPRQLRPMLGIAEFNTGVIEMKSMKWLPSAVFAGTLAFASLSCSEPDQQATAPSAAQNSSSSVAATLNGKLVKLQNGAAVAAAIQGDPEYFVFYHSASW